MNLRVQAAVQTASHYLFWAKTNRDNPGDTRAHSLICHLVDVAEVALALWEHALAPGVKQWLAGLLGLDVVGAGRLLAFWIGLHDLGKASPVFQRKHKAIVRVLESAGMEFPVLTQREDTAHGTVTAWVLPAILHTQNGISRRWGLKIARAVGGHHGAWPQPSVVQRLYADHPHLGSPAWDKARRTLARDLQAVVAPPTAALPSLSQQEENALLTYVSGFTTVADWVGSMSEHFGFNDQPRDLNVYARHSAKQAQHVLRTLGWVGWQPRGESLPFERMFAHLHTQGKPVSPRPMQQDIISTAAQISPPALAIIEAPTGAGKTEAALYLADVWLQQFAGQGIYIAMPTAATSNQLFGRTIEFLGNRYPHDQVNVHLAHGQKWLEDELETIKLEDIDPGEGGRVAAMTWFLPRKRTLLAPFGVGTVDQALLSILQTRHFFVRLFGLSHKVVIFDEVHAYDAYMSVLFHRLLRWLRVLNTSVIILSATLSEATRRKMIAAYTGAEKVQTALRTDYPQLTWTSTEKAKAIPLRMSGVRKLELRWIDPSPQAIIADLRQSLVHGGCAAVICNRVARAQEIYAAIQEAKLVADKDLILFHARFPAGRRKRIEDRVLTRFGKKGTRPRKAIVVATQVIEQSLDLDFDWMTSDFAPLDLLLQRAGRLHRYERDQRPPGSRDSLTITRPEESEAVPRFGKDEFVYAPYILLRSWVALRNKTALELPTHTVDLIEAVYGEAELLLPSDVWETALAAAWRKMRSKRAEAVRKAEQTLIPPPNDESLLRTAIRGLEDENPTVSREFQARTRDIRQSVALVCLHQTAQGLALDRDGKQLIDLEQSPNSQQTRAFLGCALSVQHHVMVAHFANKEAPAAWKKNAALRYHRVIVFKADVNDEIEGYALRLYSKLGLEIIKRE